jgi:hypothetical protein
VCSGNGTGDGRLLVIIGKALPSEVGTSSLRDLDDDGRFDVSAINLSSRWAAWVVTNLAASSTALAVEEDVTFWQSARASDEYD